MDHKPQKQQLHEVTLMRCILAILIVFMHSFTCYNHSWSEPKGFVEIPFYKWLARGTFAFALESFVFISGYLYAFHKITLGRIIKFKTLFWKKFNRLIVPSLFFSIVYYFMFNSYDGGGIEIIYKIINGCGHMWFLPMLFWCFICAAILDCIKIKVGYKVLILLILSVVPVISLPFQLNNSIKFMFYFYLGMVVYKNRDRIKCICTRRSLILGWSFFIIVFIILRSLRDQIILSGDYSIVGKTLVLIANNLCILIYATLGTLTFYLTSIFYSEKHQIGKMTIAVATYSFGIYIVHQFILKYLYYNTTIPIILGPYLLPWCGFIIAIVGSYIISMFLLKSKFGRHLIG